jgi:hypothetical protein
VNTLVTNDAFPHEAFRHLDIVLIDGGLLRSRVVKWLTQGDYSHCGFVWEHGGRKLVVHNHVIGGVQATPLDALLGFGFRSMLQLRLCPEALARIDGAALMREAQACLGTAYGKRQVIHAAAHVYLRVPPPRASTHPRPMHCSELVARCFRAAGVVLSERPDGVVTPEDIRRSPWLQPGMIVNAPQARARDEHALGSMHMIT